MDGQAQGISQRGLARLQGGHLKALSDIAIAIEAACFLIAAVGIVEPLPTVLRSYRVLFREETTSVVL